MRLWVEPVAVDRTEVRGRVQHVLTGEARYFRTWPELLAFVEGQQEGRHGRGREARRAA